MHSSDQPATLNPPVTAVKSRRRWLRFSLRTFFVLVTVLCVWLGIKINSARRQHEAVEAIYKAGGSVKYDENYFPMLLGTSPYPAWLRNVLGDDFFTDVVVVGPFYQEIANDVLNQFSKLPKATRINLSYTSQRHPIWVLKVGAIRLSNISNCKQIECLEIGDAEIAPDDWESLANLPNLKVLKITNLKIDADSVGALTKLSQVRLELSFYHATLDAESIRLLRDLPQLRQLSISLGELRSEEVAEIANLRQLEELYFLATGFTPENLDLAELQNLKNLKELSFSGFGNAHQITKLRALMPGVQIK